MIYEFLFKKALFPFYESVLCKRKTLSYVHEYNDNLRLSLDEIKVVQWKKIQNLLSFSYKNVPFYRDKWLAEHIHPNDICSYSDFAKLPIIDKSDIREHYEQCVAENHRGRNIVKSTGGSTGQPFTFELDYVSNERRQAVMWRGYGWLNAGLGCRSTFLWGATLGDVPKVKRWKEWAYHAFYNREMLDTFVLSENNIDTYVDAIKRRCPHAIITYVNPIVIIAKYIIENGIKIPAPKAILTGAEPLYEFQRQLIEKAFGAPVYNTYGCREFMLIGAECHLKSGLHLNIDHLAVDTVDEDGRLTEDVGDIVITDLHNYGMPLIRYRNGDRAKLSKVVCDCGNPLPLMESVEGRKLDVILTADGKRIPGEFFPHLFKDYRGIRQFQVIQDKIESVDIKLVLDPSGEPDFINDLKSVMMETLGQDIGVNIQVVNEIPLTSSGKLRVTINNLLAQTQ